MEKLFFSRECKKQSSMVLRILVVVVCSIFLLALGACSSPENSESSVDQSKPVQSSSSETSTESELSKVDDTSNSKFYFKDNILQISDAKIEIYDYKIIPVGETGNEYGKKPVIAFWYKTTNLSDKELSALITWMACFKAIQDNDPNVVNELSVGALPDDSFLESQMAKIKNGGTVECAVSYELDDMETPVILRATQGIVGDVLGEQIYEVK